MSEYMFGVGRGHLGKAAAQIAERHGATLVNYHDAGCRCGYGCSAKCPSTARHWFVGPNRGEPFDSALARAVLADLSEMTSRSER